MAIAGLIEDERAWRSVTNPHDAPHPKRGLLSALLGRPRPVTPQEAVHRTDFLNSEVRDYADILVGKVKEVLTSSTVESGQMGDKQSVTYAMMDYLYRRLTAMRTTDDAIARMDQLRDSTLQGADHALDQIDGALADNLDASTIAPVKEITALADQVRLLDMQMAVPKLREDMEAGQLDTFTNVESRLHTITGMSTFE